ncbi:cell division protein ZapA [Alphaproteobacteria bacterium]|jgi:cell division protein ZapA|nr:cell division protein ZapA [Alphaproteobacteria bacterium]
MGQVRITLNGRGYDIACDDGQEEHVMRLANALSERVNQLVTANGQVGEARLLLMAGLLMADDLHSERAKSAADGAVAKPVSAEGDDGAGAGGGDAVQQAYDYVADVFEQLSDRLEAVVSTLEGSEDEADD